MKKRAMPGVWSDDDDDNSSDSESSTVDSETEDDKKNNRATKSNDPSKTKTSEAKRKRETIEIDFEALKRHGFEGGPSVLNVPPPSQADDQKQDWSWSKGEESRAKETEETYADRLKTRAAIIDGERLANVQTTREKREHSFSQKEKRKRDLGQASRGKNYVEEEKRLLRESGIYSGFDS